ncbi:MAG: DEAD/DEAH box helicase, partial [Bacteroidales bacterium]|nr:DEAD/DEAH box helicase [Bacteroidales bacterium]
QAKPYRKHVHALVLTPTRELAAQVRENVYTYGKFTSITSAAIFGGAKIFPQKSKLKNGLDILVATPGRLLDLHNQKSVKLNQVQILVLDEADHMLDMGFIHDIRKIISKLPHNRQSLFFSATMPNNIVDLSKKILQNPIKVEVNPVSSTAETINQYLYYTNRLNKKDLLFHILRHHKINQVLLFSRTKHGADKIVRNLKKQKIKTAAIHGDKAQNQRQKALKQFKSGEISVLVATDIAARGIDIDKLRYVINYDIPNIAETYVHRIGRSGRAGDEGVSISICEPEENSYIKDIEKLINKKIEVINEHPYPQTDNPMTAEEKKVFEKQKAQRKQEYFAARNKKKSQSSNYKDRHKKRK